MQTRKSSAVFGQVDWPITDKFTVTGGLRYTDDKARFAGSTIALNPYGVSVAPERFPAIQLFFDNKTSDTTLSGRLTLSYTPIDEFTIYASPGTTSSHSRLGKACVSSCKYRWSPNN